jgi:hypothetical protein
MSIPLLELARLGAQPKRFFKVAVKQLGRCGVCEGGGFFRLVT